MAVRLRNMSRLRFGSLLSVAGVEFWDLLDLPEIPSQPDDIMHTVRGSERVDTIAQRYYEDPVAWWVIAKANGFEILPTELNAGDQILIPSPRFVRQALFKNARN